jgi:opacity protein-like surface antigen
MRKKLLAAILGAGVVAASPCLLAQARSNGYLGLAVGEMRADACRGAPSTVRCEDSDTALRVFGGYQVTPHLAGEIGASLLGTLSTGSGESADLTALDASAVASWPVGNRFALLGRLGAYLGNTETSQARTNTDLSYGLGASYAFTHNGTFRAEWQRFRNFGAGDAPKVDVDVLSLGAIYRF